MKITDLSPTKMIWRYIQPKYRKCLPKIEQSCLSLRHEKNETEVSFFHSKKNHLKEQVRDIYSNIMKKYGKSKPAIYLTCNGEDVLDTINVLEKRISFCIKYPHVGMKYIKNLPFTDILEIETIILELSDYYSIDDIEETIFLNQ